MCFEFRKVLDRLSDHRRRLSGAAHLVEQSRKQCARLQILREELNALLKERDQLFALHPGVEHDLTEVYTWTQRGNEDMRALNERLGYVYRSETINVRASLPVEVLRSSRPPRRTG